jgi:hypothetical protein
MQMLSEDDLNLRLMSDEELDAAWDLWFDLAQVTNPFDPPYSHGVLVGWAPPEDGHCLQGKPLPTSSVHNSTAAGVARA